MDPITISAIAELAKFGLITFISFMRQAGLTDTQIEMAFQEAKKGMLARDPALIPDKTV
jgi:hypothetical protein